MILDKNIKILLATVVSFFIVASLVFLRKDKEPEIVEVPKIDEIAITVEDVEGIDSLDTPDEVDVVDSTNITSVSASVDTDTLVFEQASTTPPSPASSPATPPSTLSVVDKLLPLSNSASRTTPITHTMIHFISNVSVNPSDPYNTEDIINIFKSTGLSSHYLIARDGTVYRLTAENRIAYHGGKGIVPSFPSYTDKINLYSIGIEMMAIGTKSEMSGFISSNIYDNLSPDKIGYTEAQYNSLRLLLSDVYSRYPAVTKDRLHVIGHDEYAPERKFDPGSLFNWSKIGL